MGRLWRWIVETIRAVTRPGDAYEEWKAMIEPVLRAGPDHPHYEAACHSMDLSAAFLFGRKNDA